MVWCGAVRERVERALILMELGEGDLNELQSVPIVQGSGSEEMLENK